MKKFLPFLITGAIALVAVAISFRISALRNIITGGK